jgi:hypothetical protein
MGSIELNRHVPGSTGKIAKMWNDGPGKEIIDDDFIRVLLNHSKGANRRNVFGEGRGGDGTKWMESMVDAAVAEGGSRTFASNLIKQVFNEKYEVEAMSKITSLMMSSQVAAKMTLALLPNMTQSLNTLAWGGIRNTAKGTFQSMKKESRDNVYKTGATADSIIEGVAKTFNRQSQMGSGVGPAAYHAVEGASQRLADMTLRYTGFNQVERWNRIISGNTGLVTLRDLVAKGKNGMLKGETLERARRKTQSMGINLDDAVAKFGNVSPAEWADIEAQAIFRAAELTQFIPGTHRRPEFWDTGIGRMMFQFKNFALGQTRFLTQQVYREAALGNTAPLAYWLAAAPVAGELVRDAKSLIKGKQRESSGLDRVIENTLAVGGIGLASDVLTAAKWGNMGEFIMGPTVSTLFDVGSLIVTANGEGALKEAKRQPVYQATSFLGKLTVMGVDEANAYLENLAGGNEAKAPSWDQMRFEGIKRKE